jgi:eukaryotic-like serine/threonine-protein kinase
MEPSVESFCNALARSRVLPAAQIRALYQRCLRESPGSCTDLPLFMRWLVAQGSLTEYQAGVIARGHGHQLFLGPYKILERIGKGRMAGVYRAVHDLGQVVAVKVLPPSKTKDPQTLGRFQREARLALRLRHPNIVRTFQAGVANDLYFLVMEYLVGETLEEVLDRRRRLRTGEAVRLVAQALEGLQQIHEEGLVHRDLKPGNLMLVGGTPDSTLGATVKVMDIGLGRALFDEDATGQNFELTNEGDLLGTPAYMAPEQARDAHGADVRADVYSLGCVLYHALTGQPPFPDANRVRQLVRHATEQPRPLRDFTPEAAEDLQAVLDAMLAKDPSQRYATPAQAAQALQRFRDRGAAVTPLEQQPEMVDYLRWLEAGGAKDPFGPPAAPAAKGAAPRPPAPTRRAAAPPPVPRPPAPRPAAPRAAAAPEPVEVVEEVQEVIEATEVVEEEAVEANEVVEELMEVNEAEGEGPQTKPLPPRLREGRGGGFGLTGRDLAMLGIGIAVVVALLAGAAVLYVVLREPLRVHTAPLDSPPAGPVE